MCVCVFFKQKTAYEMRSSDWSSDVCSSDLAGGADRVAATGRIEADVVQSCAATSLPVPAAVAEDFDLRFLRDAMPVTEAEEEVEIDSADCDILPLEGDRADLGEAAVQTLSLALDPFPRHPAADRILVEKGVLSEEQAGPFAALAKLRGKSEIERAHV